MNQIPGTGFESNLWFAFLYSDMKVEENTSKWWESKGQGYLVTGTLRIVLPGQLSLVTAKRLRDLAAT